MFVVNLSSKQQMQMAHLHCDFSFSIMAVAAGIIVQILVQKQLMCWTFWHPRSDTVQQWPCWHMLRISNSCEVLAIAPPEPDLRHSP